MQTNRLDGRLIDRATQLSFRFDGKTYQGFAGDTLASALLANDVRLVGRSFKYHRPRGILNAGSEEPSALVELSLGARHDPNPRATTVALCEGLKAKSQNRWPTLRHDMLSINYRFSSVLVAGFSYKTFMWPKAFWEKLYEPVIRRATGLGQLSAEADPDTYDKGFQHCDLPIAGAGPAGMAAALTAGRAGAKVILGEEDVRFGGRLIHSTGALSEMSGADWVAGAVAEQSALNNVRLMPRTGVIGAYDHGVYGAVEHAEHCGEAQTPGRARQTL